MVRSFQYLRPKSPRDACKLKASYGPRAVFWAGGTDLLLEWRQGAADVVYCIDLAYLDDLRYIRQEDWGLALGALGTIASLAACEEVRN